MDYGALVQAGVSLLGQMSAQGMTDQQLAIYKKQIEDLHGIQLPDLQQIKATQMGPSAAGAVQSDPAMRQQEQDVLGELDNIYAKGGLDFRDKANMADLLDSSEGQAQGDIQGIRQRLQGTGQLGSGADIAMQMGAAQQASQRGGHAARDTAALAAGRRMDALHARGAMASNMRGEDYNERMKAAEANDARTQWNAASREKAGYYNAGLPQQQFNNQMSKVTGGFAPGSNLAAAYGNEAQGQRTMWSGLGQAAGKSVNSMGGSNGQQSGGPIGHDNSGTPYYSNPDEWGGW